MRIRASMRGRKAGSATPPGSRKSKGNHEGSPELENTVDYR